MIKSAFLLLFFFYLSFCGQPQYLVHCPIAGVSDHGTMLTQIIVFPGDGLRCKVSLGLWDIAQLGLSYGAMRLIGRGSVDIDPRPGIEVRMRLFSEGVKYPAIMLGVDTQGFGAYDDAAKRFQYKSRGGYVVASKNWWWLSGNFGLHAGVNYSFEENFARGFSIFVGLDKDIKDAVGLRFEYDLAPGDNEPPRGNGYGYLSAAISIHFADNAWVCINFFDLLGNAPSVPSPSRELFVMFGTNLF